MVPAGALPGLHPPGLARGQAERIFTDEKMRRWLMCCLHAGWMKNLLHPPFLATAHNLRRM